MAHPIELLTVPQLARSMGISHRTLSRWLDHYEKAGPCPWLERSGGGAGQKGWRRVNVELLLLHHPELAKPEGRREKVQAVTEEIHQVDRVVGGHESRLHELEARLVALEKSLRG